jgi:AcrR family transcriptional regulator
MTALKNKARIPKQKRGVETKEKIINAAMVLFAEKGYHKTNALEIAAQAKVATGTFYSYFNNKKELLIEIVKQFYKRASETVLLNYEPKIHKSRIDNYKEGEKLVHFMVQALYLSHSIPPDLHKEILAMILLDKEIGEITSAEERNITSYMIFMMQKYKDFIRIDDFEAAAILLHSIADEVIHQVRIIGVDIDKKRILKELEDMICRYLLLPVN